MPQQVLTRRRGIFQMAVALVPTGIERPTGIPVLAVPADSHKAAR